MPLLELAYHTCLLHWDLLIWIALLWKIIAALLRGTKERIGFEPHSPRVVNEKSPPLLGFLERKSNNEEEFIWEVIGNNGKSLGDSVTCL